MMPYSPFELRFWSKVNKKSDFECWRWTAQLNTNGYGIFYLGRNENPIGVKKQMLAHRVGYMLTHGIDSHVGIV